MVVKSPNGVNVDEWEVVAKKMGEDEVGEVRVGKGVEVNVGKGDGEVAPRGAARWLWVEVGVEEERVGWMSPELGVGGVAAVLVEVVMWVLAWGCVGERMGWIVEVVEPVMSGEWVGVGDVPESGEVGVVRGWELGQHELGKFVGGAGDRWGEREQDVGVGERG